MLSSADRLVESYKELKREHPQMVAEALRRLARALPLPPGAPPESRNSSTRIARPTAPRRDVAGSTALPRFLHEQMRHAMSTGALDDAAAFARRLRARITGLASVDEIEISTFLLDTGVVEAMCHRPTAALADFARALRLAAGSGEHRRTIAAHASVINAVYGRLDEATRLLMMAAEARQSGSDVDSLALIASTLIAVERGDGDAEELLLRIAENDLGDFWPYAVLAHVRWALARGAFGGALNVIAIASAEHETEAGTVAESVLAYCRAAALTSIGHPRAAIDLIASIPAQTPELRLARASALLRIGDDGAADEHVAGLIRDETTGPTVFAEAALLGVWIAERRGSGDVAWATALARDAVAVQGFTRVLTTVPARISSLISPTHTRLTDVAEPIAVPTLRGSQLAVLRELRDGGTLEEIAGRLKLSIHTVRTHAKAIYKRLGVHTRADAVSLAVAHRLLS